MIDNECHEECRLNKLGRCTNAGRCQWGNFAAFVSCHLQKFGEWKLRQYASGAMCATLCGKSGRVEVWGGNHKHEVWFIEKGTKAERQLLRPWSRGTFLAAALDAVERGCKLAGIQPRLDIKA